MGRQKQLNKLSTLITETMDLMAGFEIDTPKGQGETLQLIINHLGSYPKPRQKGATIAPPNYIIGAYLCISNVRNACKLRLLEIYTKPQTIIVINSNLISALSLIIG